MPEPTLEEARAQGLSLADLKEERKQDRRDARGLKASAREDEAAFQEGKREGRTERRDTQTKSRRRSAPVRELASQARDSRAGGIVEEGAGFVFGMLLYALVLAYLRGGPDAVKGWLQAKFLNEPYTKGKKAAAPTPAKPSSPSTVPTQPLPAQLAATVPYTPPAPAGVPG